MLKKNESKLPAIVSIVNILFIVLTVAYTVIKDISQEHSTNEVQSQQITDINKLFESRFDQMRDYMNMRFSGIESQIAAMHGSKMAIKKDKQTKEEE